MKKFEYHFWYGKTTFSLDTKKFHEETEAEWNRLGADGWQYCFTGADCLIFIREKEDE